MGVATFNWSYKPGVANKYGFTVPAGADNARPSGYCYIAIWGNDSTGNGSRQFPYKTIAKGVTLGVNTVFVISSGVYRESALAISGGCVIIGDGNVIIDNTLLSPTIFGGQPITVRNIKFRGSGYTASALAAIDCIFYGISLGEGTRYQSNGTAISNCVFIKCKNEFSNYPTGNMKNCTFYDCILHLPNPRINGVINCVFVRCNLAISGLTEANGINYSLFYLCNYLVTTNINVQSGGYAFYPTIPSGWTAMTTLSSYRSAVLAQYPAQSNFQENGIYADPLFNNETVNDFTLSLTSPAKNLSYFGTYAGAYSIGKGLKVRSSATTSNFDNSSAVNLTIADDSLILTSNTIPASIMTKPIDNTAGRELAKFPVFGFNADRNGEYVDSTADLDTATVSAGTNLSAATPYIVETGSITYNSVVYQPGDRFTSLVSSPGTFTTSTGGVVREILEAPARENLEARFTDGAAGYTSSGSIAVDSWYYVEIDTITYDGNTYAVGTFFKGTATTTFTGAGSARLIFASTDPFFYFEINQKPTSNNTGNVRSGAISKGNGDKDFDRTTANVFPISKKFIQLKYTIQVNNLSA